METIYHEKQEGSLCAKHCLNALLQGPYFTAVDLSLLAQNLDDEERRQMAECGEESEDYQRFLRQPSGNMDDSGYFSVQVINSALQVWGLELVPYSSADERVHNQECNTMKAFICNYCEHWFTMRRFGQQWINLNSMLSKPTPISNSYLTLFLAQLTKEGYSVFVVFGNFPDCTADKIFNNVNGDISIDDGNLQIALEMSLNQNTDVENLQETLKISLQNNSSEDDDDKQLREAIDMSLQC